MLPACGVPKAAATLPAVALPAPRKGQGDRRYAGILKSSLFLSEMPGIYLAISLLEIKFQAFPFFKLLKSRI